MANGTWLDYQLDASRRFFKRHRVTMGTEYRQDLRQKQINYDRRPHVSYLDINTGSKLWAYYFQDEFSIRKNFIVVASLRSDWVDRLGNSYSPRLGLIYSPVQDTRLKLIYSRAFRAPNSFETFYATNTNSANTSLQSEKIRTIELELEHDFGKPFRLTASGFLNRVDRLITPQKDPATGRLFFLNSDPVLAKGFELELAAKWPRGTEGTLSYSLQNSRSQRTGNVLNNSPKQLGKANFSFPLPRQDLFASLDAQYTSRRRSVSQADLGGFFVMNATLLARKLGHNLDLSAGIYNLFDKRYADPASRDLPELSVPQDGRNFRIKLTYRLFSKAK